MGIRLADGKKFGRRISSGKKARKVRGAFGGVGRVLANSNPVFPKEKSVMGCKIGHSDVAEILLSAITSKNDPEFEGTSCTMETSAGRREKGKEGFVSPHGRQYWEL